MSCCACAREDGFEEMQRRVESVARRRKQGGRWERLQLLRSGAERGRVVRRYDSGDGRQLLGWRLRRKTMVRVGVVRRGRIPGCGSSRLLPPNCLVGLRCVPSLDFFVVRLSVSLSVSPDARGTSTQLLLSIRCSVDSRCCEDDGLRL